MWQRFTERARRVILLGQEEAGMMNSGQVGTEHLLLGLVRENEGTAAQVLQKMGISLEAVRQQVASEALPDPKMGSREPTLTPKAKRVLEFAADEARRMRHNYIGTEHLLLALLRDKDGSAATVLRRLGLNLETARSEVMNYLGPEVPQAAKAATPAPTQFASYFRLTPEALLLVTVATVSAKRAGQDHAGVPHLLAAMLADENGEAAQFLQQMGVDLNAARAALREKQSGD